MANFKLCLFFFLRLICIYNICEAISFECLKEKDTLVIRGDHVQFTDFTDGNGKLDKNRCVTNNGIKSVTVFATTKVIVDCDFIENSEYVFKLSVFAPTWEIKGKKVINLNGMNIQQSVTPETEISSSKVPNRRISEPGKDGVGGVQGNQGGSFVAIGGIFINGESLTVTVNGGAGTDGANGARGGPGVNGTYPQIDEISWNCLPFPGCNEKDSKEILNNLNKKEVFDCNTEFGFVKLLRFCDFFIKGSDGRPSGSGGNGGRGGKGGHPGYIFVKNVFEKDTILKETLFGKPGQEGKGGKAGDPGSNGKNVRYYVESGFDLNKTYLEPLNIVNGVDGKDSFVDSKSKERIKNAHMVNLANDIVEFKGYLMENFNFNNSNDFRVSFYHKFENDREILYMFDTLDLVNELRSLESRFHKNQHTLNFIQFYQSLSNRTSEYSKQPKIQSSLEDKKVLTYLYTTILNREYNIKDRSESNLVVDIVGYLELVLKEIAKHNELKKSTSMENYREQFNQNIVSKTDEATKLINTVILPEINKAIEGNKDNINNLLQEIITLEEKQKEHINDIKKKREDLKGKLLASFLCDVLSIVSNFLVFIPVVGKFASVATKIGVAVVKEELNLNEMQNPADKKDFTNPGKAAGQAYKNLLKKKKAQMNKLNNLSQTSLQKQKSPKAKALKKQLKTSCGGQIKGTENVTALKKIENEKIICLKVEVKITKKGPNKRPEDKDYGLLVHTLYRAAESNTALALAEIFLPTFSANRKKIEEMNKMINEEEEKLQQMKEYENTIRNDLSPAMDSMNSAILKSMDGLKEKSHASLDVMQWQIQSKLKQMNELTQKVTKGLNSSDAFLTTFRKLQDAINVLVKVYDRIQTYQEQQNMANLIVNINSAGSSRISISNPKMNSALNYLELVISCNRVIQLYTTAIDAFKQFVFPLAKQYLANLLLPNHLEYGNSLDDLVDKAKTQILSIKSKLDEYSSTAKKHDAWLGKAEFNSKHKFTSPFYVWNYESNSETISKLLSGEEVILFADVNKSPKRYDAIKFRRAEFNFKAEDQRTQVILNNVLDEFSLQYIHMGNSYFRTKGQLYLIMSDSLEFLCSFEKDREGRPLVENEVFSKVEKGGAMLSPYSSWSIRLIHMSEMWSDKFEILQHYKKEISLELVGYATFVNRRSIMKENIEVEKFYSPVNSD